MLQCRMASEVERLRGVNILVAGNPACDEDVHQFLTVTLARYGLEADLRGLTSVRECAYRRTILSLKEVDLQTYAQDMKTLKQAFICESQLSVGLQTFADFKRRHSGEVHCKWIFVVLERLWGSFRACLQWLAFDERLLLITNERAIAPELLDYIEFEQQLSQRAPCEGDPYPELRAIISDWLQDFSLGEGVPHVHYGPGTVAGMKGRPSYFEKAQATVWDPSVVADFCQMYYRSLDEVILGKPIGFSRTDPKDLYTNRIIFRPKNALKHRIISAEPAWLSWLQQGIKEPLYDYVERHPKMFTWFSNQEESRKLALAGSVDGSYATFDFSNASDAITVAQVESLFRDTYVVDALLATRSRYARLPKWDLVIELDKFAPMGSATCFVTMDIIMLSLCELSIRKSLGRPGRRGDYVVYGDDVIIHVSAAETFKHLSDALGFTLNGDKSYWESATPHYYRESCGIEGFDGQDVSPVRYSRFQEPIIEHGHPSDGSWLPSVVSLMNRLLLRGLWNTRSAVIEMLKYTLDRASADPDLEKSKEGRRMQHVWDRLLRVDASDYIEGSDGPCCVVVPDGTATNYRTKGRWNADLQRFEYRVSVCSAKPVETPHSRKAEGSWHYSSNAFYQCWFHRARTELRTDDITFERVMRGVAGVSDQKWKEIWVPK